MSIFWGVMIPFVGTVLGAACVFLLKNEIRPLIQKVLLGFASGVMVAASVWSLLIPAMEMSESMGRFAFVPAAVGLMVGIAFLLLLDVAVPHLHMDHKEPEGPKRGWSRSVMLVLAVTLHNIPEGMAVGVVFAGMMADSAEITLAGAFALSIGIAIQNFPEGAIVSMPLKGEGMGKPKAFLCGMASGAVEPVFGFLTILLAAQMTRILPYFLSFAAGAMIYVVVEELIPEAQAGEHTNIGTIGTAIGFALMMVLDVALG